MQMTYAKVFVLMVSPFRNVHNLFLVYKILYKIYLQSLTSEVTVALKVSFNICQCFFRFNHPVTASLSS